MRPGDGDDLTALQQSGQEVGALDDRQTKLPGRSQFWVVIVDGAADQHDVRALVRGLLEKVGGNLLWEYLCAVLGEMSGDRAGLHVAAADG